MTDRHPDEGLLLDLALSHVEEPVRDELTRHIALCEPCRSEYAAIADAVDHVLAATPRVAPPPGFSQSVLTAMGMGRQHAARRRQRFVLAAAASVSFLLGVTGGAVVMDTLREEPVVAASGPALVTSTGEHVGTILESRHYDEPVLVVTISDGRTGMGYECVLLFADGTRESGGSWVLDSPDATWIVSSPSTDAELVAMELVTDTGRVWATATL